MSIRRTVASIVVMLILVAVVGSVPAIAAPGDPEGPTNPGRCSSVAAGDYDGDGLSNGYECQIGTNASLADTDRDGLTDPKELEIGTDPTNPNTDGDAMRDGCEYGWRNVVTTLNPAVPNVDSDGDQIPNALETWGGTNPWANDTDDDLLRDGEEWNICHFKSPNPGPAHALDPDRDDDGLLDGVEVISTGTNPYLWDTDGDGWSDGVEVNPPYGTDPLDATDKPSGYPPGHP